MSLPKPTRGMLVELHGGHKDGQRVPFCGRHLRVPVYGSVSIEHFRAGAELLRQVNLTEGLPTTESYTLRQSQPDGHWCYVLDRGPSY